jgi:hypothetical protein
LTPFFILLAFQETLRSHQNKIHYICKKKTTKEFFMRKGNLVKLNPATCFTVKNGGLREWPLEHSANDRAQIVDGRRHLTEDEVAEWRNSPDSRGIDDAGESKMPPTCLLTAIHKDEILIVERARCRMSFSYYSPTGGWAKVLNTVAGTSLYVKRELLEVIS